MEDFEKMKAAASQGDIEAMHRLGLCYLLGDGVEKDFDRAYDLIAAAAEKNCLRKAT